MASLALISTLRVKIRPAVKAERLFIRMLSAAGRRSAECTTIRIGMIHLLNVQVGMAADVLSDVELEKKLAAIFACPTLVKRAPQFL